MKRIWLCWITMLICQDFASSNCHLNVKQTFSKSLNETWGKNSAMTLAKFASDFADKLGLDSTVVLIHSKDVTNFMDLVYFMRYLSGQLKSTTVKIVRSGMEPNVIETCFRLEPDLIFSFSDIDLLSDFMKLVESKQLFRTGVTFLARKSKENPQVSIPFNSNFYQYQTSKKIGAILVQEAYQISNHSPLTLRPFGFWTQETGLLADSKNIFERRKDLQGLKVDAATIEESPYVFVQEDSEGKIFGITGIIAEIWHEFERRSNFSTRYVHSIDNSWGSLEKDGTFNGIIGMLNRSETEVGIASFVMTLTRSWGAQHLKPFTIYGNGLFVKSTESGSYWMTFVKPFQSRLWLGFLVTLLVGMLVYTLLTFFSMQSRNYQPVIANLDNVTSGLMIGTRSIFGQGVPDTDEPEDLGRRLILLSLFLCGLMASSAYSGELTSYLAVKSSKLPFHDKHSLLNHGGYKLVTTFNSFPEAVFKNGGPLEKEIYERNFLLKDSYQEILEAFRTQPNLALMWAIDEVMFSLKDDLCQYKIVPSFTITSPVTIYTQTNWPYRQLMDYHLTQMVESGVVGKIIAKWKVSSRTTKCKILFTEPQGMTNLSSAFVLLSAIMVVSSVLLCLELTMSHYWKKNDRG